MVLFKECDIMPHTSKQKKYNARPDKQTTSIRHCSSWFIEMADWMAIPPDDSVQQGKIQCPRCSENVGKFFHFGAQCSCGCFVAPAYQLHKDKVDEMVKIDITKTASYSAGWQ